MIKLLVVADDLTGANDTGVQLAKQGIFTHVTMDVDVNIPSLDPDLQVLVVDTESRHGPAREAAGKVRKIVQAARRCGVAFFYKKTDSTLRGNVGAELEAVLHASGENLLAFVPAYPKTGRFTRQGYQYIDGTLLHRTAFGEDPFDPVKTSHIPEILRHQTRCTLSTVFLDAIRGDEAIQFKKRGIVLFDCEQESDLERIGRCLTGNNMLRLTAGSAGFAELLPGLLRLPRRANKKVVTAGPVLIVNGSLNKASLRQVEFAEKKGLHVITLSPSLWMQPDPRGTDEWVQTVDRVMAEAHAGRDVVIRTVGPGKIPHDRQADKGASGTNTDMGGTVAQRLGILVSAILQNSVFHTCAVFGGDTLRGVMNAMSFSGIRPVLEITPGTVLSEVSEPSRHLHLVTKAGGFGGEDIIFQIIHYVREESA